ncbi:MAG: hypothetical protein KDK89_23005 [Alphaproteobacteria bacterium]|nr:hypothetical protein [Alphaproteobacteria bacterium]
MPFSCRSPVGGFLPAHHWRKTCAKCKLT